MAPVTLAPLNEMDGRRLYYTFIAGARKVTADRMEEITLKKPVSVVNISPVIGANAGIGAAAVALLCD